MPSSISVRRMFTVKAGDTRFDAFVTHGVDHAPPAGPFLATEHQSAISCTFFRLPPKWIGEAHPVPLKCLAVCLTGEFRFLTRTGDAVNMRPGDKLLETDTTRKGHVTEVLTDIAVECLIVRLE